MSLYHEAAQILTTATEQGGSLKSLIFGKKDWKSDRKTLFALSTEAAKWSEVLSEVIEKSNVLGLEKQLSPVVTLVLTHDLLLSKKGIALPAKHGLHATISKHKARLTSELTKARLRRGCVSLEALRQQVNQGMLSTQADGSGYVHPRWIRTNALLTSLSQELETTFADYTKLSVLSALADSGSRGKVIFLDPNIPDLVAVPGNEDFSSSAAYREGRLIFQEKASCIPAYLLDPASVQGDIIDACAAPGNKTTHLATLINSQHDTNQSTRRRMVYACEKDAARSQTLAKMVKLAGAGDVVKVRAKQDFLELEPHAAEFSNVEALLLDPSCSGSGIVGRDEAKVTVHLPTRNGGKQQEHARGKKRKRGQQPAEVKLDPAKEANAAAEEEAPSAPEGEDASKLATRLANLSSFQLRLLQHAMAFPAAKRITYSTCSLHEEENECVVTRALRSDVARKRSWRVLRRSDQVEGMRSWGLRGSREAVCQMFEESETEGFNVEEIAEACIRCEKGGEGRTMGFFVVGFVRNEAAGEINSRAAGSNTRSQPNGHGESEGEDEWEGFSHSDG